MKPPPSGAGYEKAWNQAAEAAASLVESWTASDIRLAAGEMSAQEMRTVKAMQKWFATQIREHLLPIGQGVGDK